MYVKRSTLKRGRWSKTAEETATRRKEAGRGGGKEERFVKRMGQREKSQGLT